MMTFQSALIKKKRHEDGAATKKSKPDPAPSHAAAHAAAFAPRQTKEMTNERQNTPILVTSELKAKVVPVVYFGSKSAYPLHLLSNFASVDAKKGEPFIQDENGLQYRTVEHAWQAQKFPVSQRLRFAVGGDFDKFGTLMTSTHFYSGGIEAKKKKKEFWMEKNNLGVIAQMASRASRMEKLGLVPLNPPFRPNKRMWMYFLFQKFRIARFKDVLIGALKSTGGKETSKSPFKTSRYTGTETLMEFVRSAKRTGSFFGGLVEDDGTVHGKNTMGQYLMEIRDLILDGDPLTDTSQYPAVPEEAIEDCGDDD